MAYAWQPLAKLVLVQKDPKNVKNTTYGLGSEMKSEKKIAKIFFDMLFVTAQRFQKWDQTWFSCKI